MKNTFQSSWLRTLSTLVALALAIPFAWKGLTGFFTWLSPFIMLNSILALKSFVWLNIAASVVLIFVLFRKRWFCNNLCPAGWACDKISGLKKDKAKTYTYMRLPYIGKWLSVISLASALVGFPLFIFLDPMAIFNGFFTLFAGRLTMIAFFLLSGFIILLALHLVFPGIWCKKLCPLGGFQLVMNDLRLLTRRMFIRNKQEQVTEIPGRRYFLMTGLGLAAGLVIPEILKKKPLNIIRPPGTVDPSLLLSLCSRCGSCNKACPTGIIMPYTGTGNILSWMTPEVIFSTGYCLETCNLCSTVCPTGAITLFDIRAKEGLVMGTAVINLENCLLFNNTECVKCRESCKYDAIVFTAHGNILNMAPVINNEKCTGCGACKVICPQSCIEINGLA